MLPIRIEFFKKIRNWDCYYVDKTHPIKDRLVGGNNVSVSVATL